MSARPALHRRLPAILAATLAAVVVLAAGACSAAGGGPAGATVTVTVGPGAAGAGQGPPGGGAGADTAGSLPTRLAVGHERGAPHSFTEAWQRIRRARIDGAIKGTFRSPSGNIKCDVSNTAAVAECILDSGRIAVPDRYCPAAPGDRVRGVELTDRGAFPVCAGTVDAAETAAKLRYGDRTVVPDSPFTCLSERAGVTCVDTDYQRGFFIAKNTFVTF